MKFTKKKRERKAAALIALAAEKKGSVTSCLTDEEMTLLVEEHCSEEEKDKGWAHLSDCHQCYEQWYLLKTQEDYPRKKKGVIVHLMRPKTLALVGSTLAVAVSVAVFLNISHDPLVGRLAEKPIPSLPMAEEAENSFSQTVDVDAADDEAVSREGSGQVYQRMEVAQKNDQVEVKKKRKKIAAAPKPAENILATTVMSEQKMAAAPEKSNPIEQWLEKVREGCLKRENEEGFWSEIVREGEQLFQETVVDVQLHEKKAKAIVILQMVPRLYDVDSVTKQCELIFAELAEDGNTR